MKLLRVLGVLCLAAAVAAQGDFADLDRPTGAPGSGAPGSGDVDLGDVSTEPQQTEPRDPIETEAPTEAAAATPEVEETEAPRTPKRPTTKLNCSGVECDRAVLEECDRPVLFLREKCCPICPSADVCADVECAVGETCSDRNGEAVCCTEKNSTEHREKVRKQLHPRFGFQQCAPNQERRSGVNAAPCRSDSCENDELCISVYRRAYCCPRRQRTTLPPCEGPAAVQPTLLERCHAPGTPAPTTPTRRSPGCHCSRLHPHHGRHRGRGRPRATVSPTTEASPVTEADRDAPAETPAAEVDQEEEATEATDIEEPTEATETEPPEADADAPFEEGGSNNKPEDQGGNEIQPTEELEFEEKDGEQPHDRKARGAGYHGGFSGRRYSRYRRHGFTFGRRRRSFYPSYRRRPYVRRRPPMRPPMRCRCGFSLVRSIMSTWNKLAKQLRGCRSASRRGYYGYH